MGTIYHLSILLIALPLLSTSLLTACRSSRFEHTPSPSYRRPELRTGDIVTTMARGKDGRILHMYFNNVSDTATLRLCGETIELKGQRPASAIWYANDQYELRGKGSAVELKKDGILIFQNE